eukprot:1158869-Pelagomonas_calceolata.AAC.2
MKWINKDQPMSKANLLKHFYYKFDQKIGNYCCSQGERERGFLYPRIHVSSPGMKAIMLSSAFQSESPALTCPGSSESTHILHGSSSSVQLSAMEGAGRAPVIAHAALQFLIWSGDWRAGDSRATLRHYEMVAVMQNFSPLAPLHKHGVPISGPKFYHAVITDWNLYLFSRKGADAGKVVLDMPLLCVRDLFDSSGCTQQDSNPELCYQM